jgi:fructokinase
MSSTTLPIFVLGEALMDCIAQPDGQLRPLMGGCPFNTARAAALHGAAVSYLNPLSTDFFGQGLHGQLERDGVQCLGGRSALPTSLAVVQLRDGSPSYGFYRSDIADRHYTVEGVVAQLKQQASPGILYTGSLMLIPPDHQRILAILEAARSLGWIISVDVNLRPKMAQDLGQYLKALHQVIGMTDWLKASDEDLETMGYQEVCIERSQKLVDQLRANAEGHVLSRIALTYGKQGAHLEIEGRHHQQPVPQVTVLDTVGAGDTFWGNTLADWSLQNWAAPERIAQTLDMAMKAAAINCTRQGCQPPTRAEVLAYT